MSREPAPSIVKAAPNRPHVPPLTRSAVLRRIAPSLVVNVVVSTGVYFLLRSACESDVTALVLTGSIPAGWTLGRLALQRRIDPIGLLAVAGYAVAVLVTVASGGNVHAVELQEPLMSGALGVVCLGSVAIGYPLHRLLLHRVRGRTPSAAVLPDRTKEMSTMVTAIAGGTLVLRALALVVLALSVSPATYVMARHPLGLSIIGLGAATLKWSRQRVARGLDTERPQTAVRADLDSP